MLIPTQPHPASPIPLSRIYRDLRSSLRLRLWTPGQQLHREVDQEEVTSLLNLFIDPQGWRPGGRIGVWGEEEWRVWEGMDMVRRRVALEALAQCDLPALFISALNLTKEKAFGEKLKDLGLPVFSVGIPIGRARFLLEYYLRDQLSPRLELHGTLVDVYGTGLLFLGVAGIGKSEVALDLVQRGHRLVADDVVYLTRKEPGVLIGYGAVLLKHLLEIRGVGVVDVRKLFGTRAIRLQKRVEVAVELVEWDPRADFERLLFGNRSVELLGVRIPFIRLPVFPGKNVGVIAESIALGLHLFIYGEDPGRELVKKQRALLQQKSRILSYLKGDTE